MRKKEVQLTITSPKGQVVIPQEIRENMKIKSGTRFAVYGKGDTIIFKRVVLPSVRDFEKIAKFGRSFAKRRKIKENDVIKND
jgi:AbrB family looped-hinge helix DNA binding protein